MSITDFSDVLFNALSFSSILILTALGLAITFGVMRVINMAHGEMLMLGAYTAYVVTSPQAIPIVYRNLGRLYNGFLATLLSQPELARAPDWHTDFGLELSFFWAIPLSFLVVGVVGYLLEVGMIRFLYGRPLDTLLATWGVSLVVQQVVLLLFEADLKPVNKPEIISGHWKFGDVAVPHYRLFVVAITILCLLAVYLLFYRTSFGLKVRAVTQNRPMASALGISTRWVDSLTFAFATGLAGVAGCIVSGLYTVKYNMGLDYVVEAFMVVIMGGVGQLPGTALGGALLGSGDSVVEKILVNAPMAKVVVLLCVVVFILIRPAGILATRERSYD
jgi:urea transport system permease protein